MIMEKSNTPEFEYLSLICNYPDLLEKTVLTEEFFFDKDKIIFQGIYNCYKKNKAIVEQELMETKGFDIDYYVELLTKNVYTTTRYNQMKALEKIIIENYKSKKTQEIIKKYSEPLDEKKLFEELEKVKNIKITKNETIEVERMLDVLSETKTQIKLGYNSFDKVFRVEQNDFVVIAGGTGTGKTSFALNLLSSMSKEYQCVYFNMEMSEKVLYKRLTSIETGIDIRKLNNFQELTANEYTAILQAISNIGEREIILVNGKQTIESITKTLSNIDTDKPLVVILDHIGLINSKGNGLYEKMTNVAKGIRALCFECNCTIFGLCQLSRESQKEERVPKLQDLRDSGEIEQSSRKVLLLYNKDLQKENRIKDITLYVAKDDSGGHIYKDMKFDVYTQRICEVDNR